MNYLRPQAGRFYCFSPPVMIATFFIEIMLAVHTVWRYKLTPVTRLATLILVCLATFQLAEYNICEGALWLSGATWARVGFVAITLLPPLGLHLATKIVGDNKPALVGAGYAAAAGFGAFFAFVGGSLGGPACMGNYVIFQIGYGAGLWYGLYYYALLILAVAYIWRRVRTVDEPHIARALNALAVGYLAFMLPVTLVNFINPATLAAIPSIMCGFAVLLALILSGEVLPRYHKTSFLPEQGLLRRIFGR